VIRDVDIDVVVAGDVDFDIYGDLNVNTQQPPGWSRTLFPVEDGT